MLAVGEHLRLQGEECAARVDEIEAREAVLRCDLRARKCFFTVSGKYEPPLTVASFATITHSRPSTTPMPVTIPALGASSS